MRRILPAALFLLCAAWALADPVPSAHPVYPAKGDGLKFSHRDHRQPQCTACHAGGGFQERPEALSLTGHTACRSCHAEADEGRGKSEACRRCHLEAPRSEPRTAPSLKFSHRLHASVPGGCTRCHDLGMADEPTGLWPLAERCQECHASLMAGVRCEACHPAGADGRLLTSVAGGRLMPRGGHGGDDHGGSWEHDHGRVALRREEQCRACHTTESCDACHRGVQRPYRFHPPDWELSHAGEARAGLLDCSRCHRSQSECLACHRNAEVAESSTDRPKNVRLHPAGYGDGRHAADARRNLTSCTSCHSEQDCIRCHGSAGKGLGYSPHPPGFSGRCRLLRSRNERPCLKCHAPADLEARCP